MEVGGSGEQGHSQLHSGLRPAWEAWNPVSKNNYIRKGVRYHMGNACESWPGCQGLRRDAGMVAHTCDSSTLEAEEGLP